MNPDIKALAEAKKFGEIETAVYADRKLIGELVALLGEKNGDVRTGVLNLLSRVGFDYPEDVRPFLDRVIALLDEEDMFAKVDAATAVGNLTYRVKDAVPRLVTMLEGGDDDEREAAAHALGKLGIIEPDLIHGILPKLVEVLEFSKEATCGGVLFALGAIGLHYPREVAGLVPRLIQYLDSGHPNAVKNAIAALGNIGSTNPEFVKDAVPKIREHLESTDTDIKMNAKVALGRLGDPSAM